MQELSLEQAERLHAQHIETGLNAEAGKLRRKVRAYCEDNALAVPEWANEAQTVAAPLPAPTSRKHKRNPNVLEARAARHEHLLAIGNRHDAGALRVATRAWCAAAGVPVPDWAKLQIAPKPQLAPEERLQSLHDWRDAADGRSVEVASDGSVTLLRRAESGLLLKATFPSAAAAVEQRARWSPVVPRPALPRAEPLDLPKALREWRSVSTLRVVKVANDGSVTLLRREVVGTLQATFPNLAAAAAAVEPPIAWVPLVVPQLSWAATGRR